MSNVIELRQYTLKPGRRDTLIELFEHEFIESQEEVGIDVIGTFRDADDPDRFVWVRGYPDMENRARSLRAFYGGALWGANRDAAAATMVDTDNVLLLRPAWDGSGFASGGARAPRGASEVPEGFVVAAIGYFDFPVPDEFIASFRGAMPSRCAAVGATFVAALVSDPSANNYPAHPIREGEHVLVWFSRFTGAAATRAIAFPRELEKSFAKPTEILRLRQTARSRELRNEQSKSDGHRY